MAPLLAFTTAAACTAPSKPAPPKVSFSFLLPSDPTGPGAIADGDVNYRYFTAHAPKGSKVVLQQQVGTGRGARYLAYSEELPSVAMGTKTLYDLSMGRFLYRMILISAQGKVLAIAPTRTLDVYGSEISFGVLFNRTLEHLDLGNGQTFPYYFRFIAHADPTSCRRFFIRVYNDGAQAETFTIIPNSTLANTAETITVPPKGTVGIGRSAVPGHRMQFELQGDDLYGYGTADCFTENGQI